MFPLPWKQLKIGEKPNLIEMNQVTLSTKNNCPSSKYLPPSCKGKICTIIQPPWHLAGSRSDEGRGPPLIGTFKGKILIDQVDLEKAQNEDSALLLVKSWFNSDTGKIDERKIDTSNFEDVHDDVLQLYKVRKQLRLTDESTTGSARLVYLLEDEFGLNPKMRVVIPPSHRYQALLAVHVREHWGVQRTTQQVKEHFFWPGWRADTAQFVTECPGCLHREQVNLKQVDPFDGRVLNVNEVLCVDLVGPITISGNKNKYILTLLDQFSRYVAAVPLPDKSARSVVNAIMTNWISLYGAPATIRMDQGKEFDNNLLKNLLNALDVNIKLGFSHNHQSNPIERFHRTLWALLRAKKANGENDWEKSLPTLILAYNATQHFSTNSSPARIFLGRELNLPHLSLLPKFVQNDNPPPPLR